jgi:hypothetical protein
VVLLIEKLSVIIELMELSWYIAPLNDHKKYFFDKKEIMLSKNAQQCYHRKSNILPPLHVFSTNNYYNPSNFWHGTYANRLISRVEYKEKLSSMYSCRFIKRLDKYIYFNKHIMDSKFENIYTEYRMHLHSNRDNRYSENSKLKIIAKHLINKSF